MRGLLVGMWRQLRAFLRRLLGFRPTTPRVIAERQLSPTCRLVVSQGDITLVTADAVVNAANEGLVGGGGVDGAIHRAAGPDLRAACRALPEVRPGVRCPTGEARLTPGYRLTARHVIHAVGPVYRNESESAPQLESAYRSALALANEHGLRTIAFPAISCGVFGYPLQAAARVAIETCRAHHDGLTEVHFVLYDPAVVTAFREQADALPDVPHP